MSENNLLDQWAFSTDTAFRIPQLMRELRANLVWSKITHLKDNPLIFIRRILTGSADENELAELAKGDRSGRVFPQDYDGPPILYDFTFSSRLQKFFDHQETKTAPNLAEFRIGIKQLLEVIKTHPNEWRSVLTALSKNHQLEFKLAKRLMDDFSWAAYEASPLRWLSELYWLYSRCSHFGFAAEELTKVHFNNRTEYSTGGSDVLAYLLRARKTSKTDLPQIEGLFRINMASRTVSPALNLDAPKPQNNGRFYFLGLNENDYKALDVFPKFFAALYDVFNEFVEREVFHQVYIPVYERDIFTASSDVPNSQTLEVAGTFLGWLCYDFGDNPPHGIFADEVDKDVTPDPNKWCFGAESAVVSPTFSDDLVHLRFLLNQFSEEYLEGEKEWALEQRIGHSLTLEKFVAGNIHHFGGWFGNECHTEKPPWLTGKFFEFRRSEADPSGKEVTSMLLEGTDELWIDVTSKPEWEASPDKRPLILKLKRRNDTALPTCERALRDYGVYVSKSVRNFFDRAKLLEVRQELGRSILSQEFAHEVKHAAEAVSTLWLTKLEAKAHLEQYASDLLIDGRSVRQLLENAPLALLPELFDCAANQLGLWVASGSGAIELLSSDSCTSASPLRDLVNLASRLALANTVCMGTKTLEINSKQNINEALKVIASARSVRFEITGPADRISFRKSSGEQPLNFVRLFAALFGNCFRHGDVRRGIRCVFEVNARQETIIIGLSNHSRQMFADAGANTGSIVISKLAHMVGGEYERLPMVDAEFRQQVRIPFQMFAEELTKGEWL